MYSRIKSVLTRYYEALRSTPLYLAIPLHRTVEHSKNDMGQKICQSCGLPLTADIAGTNADGGRNDDYCIHCFKNGKFTQDMTMEQMIDHCTQFTDEINRQSGQCLTQEQAKAMMRRLFPHLKRWRN